MYRLPPHRTKKSTKQMLVLACSLILMFSAWIVVYILQLTGYYVPKTIYVQFDDFVRSELGTYSGAYKLEKSLDLLGFKKSRYSAVKGNGQFGYCRSLHSWTFKYDAGDPCKDFVVRSSRITSNDIVDSADESWFVSSHFVYSRFYPMENFHLSIGCIRDAECGGKGRGRCDEAQCSCENGYFGAKCDFSEEEVCRVLKVEDALGQFLGTREFSYEYDLLKNPDGTLVTIYDHPVFSKQPKGSNSFDIMMYTGFRWVLFYSVDGFKGVDLRDSVALAEHLSEEFRAGTALSRIEFTSEEILYNTPLDAPTPIGLEWFVVRNQDMSDVEIGAGSDATLLCAICDEEDNPCLNDNTCNPDGSCNCGNGATGTLCQITPLGNGK